MKTIISILLTAITINLHAQNQAQSNSTFTIVVRDSVTGDLAIAVQSRMLAVGAIVPYAISNIGAIATQGTANTSYGARGMEMLASGLGAKEVVEALIKSDSKADQRQVGIVDSRGNASAFSGYSCPAWSGHLDGRGYVVLGTDLTSEVVLKAMARTFEVTSGDIYERMIAALSAAENAEGDKLGRQSAALLVVRDRGGYGGNNDRYIDLRVDDNPMPLVELKRLIKLWEAFYLTEARMRTVDTFDKQRNVSASQGEMNRIVEDLYAELRKKPDDPDVLKRVAWLLTTQEIDRERALEYAKRASKLAPGRSDILATLAECHYRLGNFDQAIAIMAELAVKEPSNDEHWNQLQRYKEGKQKSGR